MASTYRDRTAEFRSLSQTLQKLGGRISAVDHNHPQINVVSKSPIPPSLSSRSEFNKKASLIGSGIHETSQKIGRLAKLAKRSSMFDDPIVEIQELTALIKTDITTLNTALSDLQLLQNMEIADGNYSQDRFVHSTTVSDDLKNKLMGATKHFQDVLTARTENIKAHENRKQIFSKSTTRENPFQRQTKSVTEPPPWSSSSNVSESSPLPGPPMNGVQAGSQLSSLFVILSSTTHIDEGQPWMAHLPNKWKCPCCSKSFPGKKITLKAGQLLFRMWNLQFQNLAGSLRIWQQWFLTCSSRGTSYQDRRGHGSIVS